MNPPVASHHFALFFAKVDAALSTYTDVVAGRVTSEFAVPVAAKLLVLAFLVWGYAVKRGMVQEPLNEGAFRMLRLSFIVAMLDLSTYHAYIADFFLTAPDQLAAIVTGEHDGDSVQFIDSLWSQMDAFGQAFWDKGAAAGYKGFGLDIIALLIWGVNLATCVIAGGLLLLAKEGMSLWIAFGTIFILASMFDATKQFTNAWLGQVVSFALLPMLVGAVLQIIPAICVQFLGDVFAGGALADPAINQIWPAMIMCVFTIILLWQVPSLASGLGGGVAISTMGVMGAAARMLKGGADGVGNLLSGKTLNDARHARRQKASNAAWAKNNPGLTARAAGMPMAAYRKMTGPRNTVSKS